MENIPAVKNLDAVREWVRARDTDPDHAFQVCAIALSLFDQTRETHRMADSARLLLEAAALLHDIGYTTGFTAHHKRSRDLILTFELPGIGERERMIAACTARYHRKAFPQPRHRVYRDLEAEEQEIVRRLAAILRIADGLDRRHAASVEAVTPIREENTLRIRVYQSQRDETDLLTAAAKARLFTEVFGLRVEIIPAGGNEHDGYFAAAAAK